MIITNHTLKDIFVSLERVSVVRTLMTPRKLLSGTEFKKPLIIHPEEFTSFDDLIRYREKIRMLELVPIKNDEIHDYYNSLNKKELVEEIHQVMVSKSSPIFLWANRFLYWLSEDCDQSLIWISKDVDDEEVINFITKVTKFLKISTEELILFERPPSTKSLLVKGTLSDLRHIHFWNRSPELQLCEECVQMTNHRNNKCLKCKNKN